MIRPSRELEDLDLRWARERVAGLTYPEALALFAAMWREAGALAPEFPGDWREDLGPDLAIARAVNGLPPHA